MPTHKEFTAWISVNGKTLPEYQVEVEKNGRKAFCYIPSEAGQVCTGFSLYFTQLICVELYRPLEG